jgi:hypothetical protein
MHLLEILGAEQRLPLDFYRQSRHEASRDPAFVDVLVRSPLEGRASVDGWDSEWWWRAALAARTGEAACGRGVARGRQARRLASVALLSARSHTLASRVQTLINIPSPFPVL